MDGFEQHSVGHVSLARRQRSPELLWDGGSEEVPKVGKIACQERLGEAGGWINRFCN